MTSISVPASVPVLSPFDSTPGSPPRSSPAHRRRASRNPNAPPPLPQFSFNPGGDENVVGTEGMDITADAVNNANGEADRRLSKPLPLPEFKFNPGADLPTERSSSPTHPVLQEMALNQQRAVRSARPAPLPAFTFNPSPAPEEASPSPTKGGFSDVQQSLRGGHRRGGSEFVGGSRTDGPQMVSTSPEKPEYRPHPPMSGIRGHAHRRSQAVSISDIDTSELIKANAVAKARAGSTPTTPSDGVDAFVFPRSTAHTRQSMSGIVRTPPSSPRRRGSAPGIRPRVGFSDHVDVIPRPLSMISSETEGSNSTIRGCHSLSGSINSIAASPTPNPTLIVSPSNDAQVSPERPKTADALSTLSQGMASDKTLSMINLPKRPLSASGSPGTLSSSSPPNKKKYFWFNHPSDPSPLSTPKAEVGDPMDIFTSPAPNSRPSADVLRPRTSSSGSASKKRKYHTWTSGIFSRKSEKRSGKLKRGTVPAPPPLTRTPSDHLNEIFDADDTIVLREPSPVSTRVRASLQNLAPLQNLPSSVPQEQIMSPVIDLDAALGPFGSEQMLAHDGATKQPPRLAKLHSSERRGAVDAFGTVHRRTESAPVMPAVNRSTFGLHHIGSNASLSDDVFDEEEEDNFLAGENATQQLSPNRSVAEVPAVSPPLASLKMDAPDGLGLSMCDNPGDGVIIVDSEDDITRADDNRSSMATIEAPVFHHFESRKRPMSSPMTFAYPAPRSHYTSSTDGRTTSASMISSPDADHFSFDTMSPPSRSLGEPSPDMVLRASNDDLPSLSDSISSGVIPRISSSAGTRSSVDQRSASMIVPSTSRRLDSTQAWKRSSLASLNRLIPGSSHGSKLKFETVPDGAAADEKSRKKTNRLSKLMLFWRSKERIPN
ncbi:hypothetical protein A1O7_09673 [Cladophialophora yegresii CBS 114405]|uniref:Cell wall proline rich protein n=1 Tax=Cladophialophora yegresii CBS 114405 TaxID=1182544 RepID=W9W725_9EURO|nr:uncharacterized protein A1O7_09673 [Cladophialophora yegresii CBS 114405]EXJ54334.1 hypothetical protein A1O7_09673 [Cladophialophora yegresii CBS 114405]